MLSLIIQGFITKMANFKNLLKLNIFKQSIYLFCFRRLTKGKIRI